MRPLPEAASAGRIARIDRFLVGVEDDPVLFRREIRAVGGVEFVGVDVADELHRLCRLRIFRVRRLVVPCERDLFAVRAGDDGAKLVGAQNGDARLLQPGEGLLVGVTVGVDL